MTNIETVDSCPLCNSKNRTRYAVTKSFFTEGTDLVDTFYLEKCSNCGFVYVSNRPTKSYILNYYQDDGPFYNSANTEVIEPTTNLGKRYLDIGFGNGAMLLNKYKKGWECSGTDISGYAVERLQKINPKFNLFNGELSDAKYQDDYFDLITLSHVLEHDFNPIALLQEIKRILKPGGDIVIDIPSFGGLYYSLFGDKCEFFTPQHLSFFTRKTLALAIEKAGFTKYRLKNIFGNNTSYHILHKLGIQKSYFKKSIFNKILGLCVFPIETFLQKGDALRAFLTK